ncbi:hypothetical protein Ancab_026139 [Ancistrocladus abbreviatus]
MAGNGSPEAASSPDSTTNSPPSSPPPQESGSESSQSPPKESPPQSPPHTESSPPPPDSSPPPPLHSSPPLSDNNSQPPPSDSSNNSQPPPDSSNNNSQPPPSDSSNHNSQPPPSDSSNNNSQPPPSDSTNHNSQPPPSDSSNYSSQPPPSDSSNSNSQPPPSASSNEASSHSDKNDSGRFSPSGGGGSNSSSFRSPPHSPDFDSRRPDFSPPVPVNGAPNNALPSADSVGSGRSSGSPSPSSSSSLVNNRHIPVIIGAAAAGALFVMIIICLVCCRRKKRKHDIPYAWDTQPAKGNQYGTGAQGMDHAVKIPPSPGGHPGGGWSQPSPPPHVTGTSGEMSSPFSGSNRTPLPPPSPGLSLGINTSMFAYEELAAATNGFAQTNMLGQGGFGFVHKGVLPNGKEIAVKSLKSGSGQGEREFQSEVEIISRVHHRHLVSLVGYCIAGGQRMLVYEFVPNDNLEFHLHKRADTPLDFPTRLKIALGSAKGLAYLHEDCHPRIIHRDIKASNILLDYNFEAQVADFGLAKLTTDTNTHVSTRVMGTFGYLAPEYASSGKLTEKSDVFSFGVMLLELITRRRPVDPNMTYMEDSLVDWARPLLSQALQDGNFIELADPRLEQNYNPQEMARMVACAAASIRHSARRRPKMSQIVRALEGDVSLDDLNEGTKPGQSTVFGSSSNGSSDYDAGQYSADLKKFRQMAFGSQGFASNMFDGNTSEYGLNPSSTSSDTSGELDTRKLP